jgi:GNAT superfamily N-acetyltransferase
MPAPFSLRAATLADVSALEQLIALSARGLARDDYTDAQIEASIGTAWGVDTQLIVDQTYYVAEVAGQLVGCGGWGRRETLFGGDHQSDRSAALLDPARDPARIRAFFVHPDWARRGIATALLELSEREAAAHGFRSLRLIATLTGWPFYRRFGYVEVARRPDARRDGTSVELVDMRKTIGR